MTGSSFDQSFPETSGRPVAVGHDERGEPLPGGWQVRADLAAAGLWTTATDLAQLVREIHLAYRGDPALLSRELAVAQLTTGTGGVFGLGCDGGPHRRAAPGHGWSSPTGAASPATGRSPPAGCPTGPGWCC